MSRIHKLTSVQKIPTSLEQAWSFFSNPKNLLTITPPFLNLKVKEELIGNEVYAGQVITYKIKPALGIPVLWVTQITQVEPQRLFVDEQRKGPYKLWHHQHHFKAVDGGIEMTDIVHYQLPLGLFGTMAHSIAVKKKLREIFTYRYYKINELFGDWPMSELNLEIE